MLWGGGGLNYPQMVDSRNQVTHQDLGVLWGFGALIVWKTSSVLNSIAVLEALHVLLQG